MRLILLESCIVSLAGSVLGVIGSVGLVAFLSRVPSVQGLIRSDTSPTVIGTGLAMALGIGVLGALYPAWRGATVQPTEALRYE